MAEYPSAANGYTLIIDFNDNGPLFADWYEGEITALATTAVTLSSFGASSGLGAWPVAVAPLGLAVAVAGGLVWRRRRHG